MAQVRIDSANLVVAIDGFARLLALKRRLRVPLTHVRGATSDPGIVRESKGWNAPGARLPGFGAAGTFRHEGERVFWDVRHPQKAIVIELEHEHYQRVIVEVEDPNSVVDMINNALPST